MAGAAITPLLFLGDPEDAVWLDDITPVATSGEAVDLILNGHGALLPKGDWTSAGAVLTTLGCDDEWIARHLLYAKTGLWL